MKTYTEDEIKAAFWAVFKGAGDIWFPYFEDSDQDGPVQAWWEDLKEKLEGE